MSYVICCHICTVPQYRLHPSRDLFHPQLRETIRFAFTKATLRPVERRQMHFPLSPSLIFPPSPTVIDPPAHRHALHSAPLSAPPPFAASSVYYISAPSNRSAPLNQQNTSHSTQTTPPSLPPSPQQCLAAAFNSPAHPFPPLAPSPSPFPNPQRKIAEINVPCSTTSTPGRWAARLPPASTWHVPCLALCP